MHIPELIQANQLHRICSDEHLQLTEQVHNHSVPLLPEYHKLHGEMKTGNF